MTLAVALRPQLRAALELSALGLAVIPLHHPGSRIRVPEDRSGKKPLIEWDDFKARRPTPEELHAWFDIDDPRNLGVVCGRVSGVVVIDCDDEDALGAAEDCLPATPVRTVTAKGSHLFFGYPEDAQPDRPDVLAGYFRQLFESVETDGKKGHRWSGVHTLLLTTRGRRSGKLRRTALIYGRDEKRYLVVASRGGADNHPAWYLNLVENPEVRVQVEADKFTARSFTATPEEKLNLWKIMTSIWPEYDEYQAKTKRDIPVVILERTATNE